MQSPIPACPTCERLNQTAGYRDAPLRSSVSFLFAEETMMYCAPFRSEDGQHHVHDMNWTTSRYQCSLGHQFRVVSPHACPSCDFGHQPAKAYEADPNPGGTVVVR